MKKFIILPLIALAIICLIIYYFLSSKHATDKSATVNVAIGSITAKVTAMGNIMPIKTATVKSAISGTVAQLFHDEGDYVKKGDKLLEINPEPTPDIYAQRKQQVLIDLAAEAKDKKDVARYEYLLKQGAISKNDQDYAKAVQQYETDHLTRVLDEERLSLIEKGRAIIGGHSVGNIIVSPTDGFIVERDVNLGDPVTPQSDYQQGSPLFVIADMDNLIFKGQVSETDAAKLHPNMPATVKIAALPNLNIKGTLTKLALQSVQSSINASNNFNASVNSSGQSSSSGSTSSPFNVGFNIEIHHLNIPKDIKLRAGYSATADIIVNNINNTLLIPERVLQFENNQTYVWILNQNGKPQKQYIKTGIADGVNVQVISGLKSGDKILENSATTTTDNDE